MSDAEPAAGTASARVTASKLRERPNTLSFNHFDEMAEIWGVVLANMTTKNIFAVSNKFILQRLVHP